jgi:hypothetical protein
MRYARINIQKMRERMAVIYRYEQQTPSFTAHKNAAFPTA